MVSGVGQIVVEGCKLSGPQLIAYLEQQGIQLAHFERWRLALAEDGQSSVASTKKIRTLERELARKEKALAEAATLLVLKKTIESHYQDEDDDTGE